MTELIFSEINSLDSHLLMRFNAPETAWGQTVVFSFA